MKNIINPTVFVEVMSTTKGWVRWYKQYNERTYLHTLSTGVYTHHYAKEVISLVYLPQSTIIVISFNDIKD